MKKQIIIPVVMLFLFSLALVEIVPVKAQTKEFNQPEQKRWITYEGSKDGIILFDVSYNNPGRKKSSSPFMTNSTTIYSKALITMNISTKSFKYLQEKQTNYYSY